LSFLTINQYYYYYYIIQDIIIIVLLAVGLLAYTLHAVARAVMYTTVFLTSTYPPTRGYIYTDGTGNNLACSLNKILWQTLNLCDAVLG